MIHFIIYTTRHLTFLDYMDFLRRARRKLHLRKARQRYYGNYLDVCDYTASCWIDSASHGVHAPYETRVKSVQHEFSDPGV
jgi:hypothetical protein